MKKNTYKIHWSNSSHSFNATSEIQTTSELNARLIALKNCKEFGPGDLKTQRQYVQEWRERYISKIEVVSYPSGYCRLCETVMSAVYDSLQNCNVCSECEFPLIK